MKDTLDHINAVQSAALGDEWWKRDESWSQLQDLLTDCECEIVELRDELTEMKLARERAERALREVLDRIADVRRGVDITLTGGPRLMAVIDPSFPGDSREIDRWEPYDINA